MIQAKRMCFIIEDDQLLGKINTIWSKLSADIKNKFDSKPAYNKTFFKNKTKSYDD